jgi:hypothetical protein
MGTSSLEAELRSSFSSHRPNIDFSYATRQPSINATFKAKYISLYRTQRLLFKCAPRVWTRHQYSSRHTTHQLDIDSASITKPKEWLPVNCRPTTRALGT